MNKYDPFIQELSSTKLINKEPLATHTYFKIGGPADLFLPVDELEELLVAVRLAIKHSIPYFILGGGSNILATDKGFRGLVIKNKTSKISLKGFSGSMGKGKPRLNKAIIQAESGVPTNKLIRYSLDEGLKGLEHFLGLPGTIGGAVYNNSHHLGKLIGDTITEVEVLDSLGERKKYNQQEMNFAYDYSILHKTKETVLLATFQLTKGNKDKLWTQANAAVQRRTETQPLGVASSGCIFKNISLSDAMRLGTPNRTCSAGYLIDKSGCKGMREGGAVVSDQHANFIINDGGATFANVMSLIHQIQQKVSVQFSVDLELEIVILGEQ